MIYRKFLSVVVILSLVLGCSESLKEYEITRVSQDLASDLDDGKVSFRSVCGFACSTPGVGIAYNYCYEEHASILTIDGTGDMIESEEHFRFKMKALEYAKEYNRQLLTFLNEANRRSCAPSEDWDSWLSHATEFIRKIDHELSGVGVPRSLNEDFEISIRNAHDPDSLMGEFCRLYSAHGIDRRINIGVTRTQKIHNAWQHNKLFRFKCEQSVFERL